MVSYKRSIKGKRILITGGTGSFGSTMTKALLENNPKEIVVFSRDELKQFEMRNKYDDSRLQFVIGDIRDKQALDDVMQGIDFVFHAAALKQVPSAEFFPMEAVKTNVTGGYNVMHSAMRANVAKVVVLSTDKAVYPVNAMGISKALMEKVMYSLAREAEIRNSKTMFCGVRYGNVMYSRGSVIPYFIELMQEKQNLRITDPLMTRFLLPLSDSVDLVLHALTKGKNGSMYVKKAPAATIGVLADALCNLLKYDKSKRTIVGTRYGEKTHETLVSAEEWARVKDEKSFYQIPIETKDLEYAKYFEQGKKLKYYSDGYTSANTRQLDISKTEKLLMKLPQIQKLV